MVVLLATGTVPPVVATLLATMVLAKFVTPQQAYRGISWTTVFLVAGMIPIAVSAANQLDISPRPVLMSLCVGAAVAFLTPVATPANLMVMSPAGYRFGDYWKLGLPLVVVLGVVAVLLVPLVWSF